MASIELRGISKRFDAVVAVNRLSIDLREGELVALLGPSGCGKTTTLRMIAGFETPNEGEIFFGDTEVSTLPPERRNAGMVFQNYALFPHLSVFENVAYGLKMRKVAKAEIERRVSEILSKMQLSELRDRRPRQLSGGQQQRTALARALVINPAALLLDEPLANLDAKLREEMRFFIRSLQQEFGITTVYVTHDQSEALVLADRIAVMMGGVLQQLSAPEDIYRRPRTAQVADFIGLTNLIPGTVTERSGETLQVDTPVGLLLAKGVDGLRAGDPGLVSIRPEYLYFDETAAHLNAKGLMDSLNRVHGVIQERSYLGNLIDYRVEIAGRQTLRVQSGPEHRYGVGDDVTLTFSGDDAWVVSEEGGTP
ncbi:MAG TPA: ABC transporter ATP-binding protein [Thermomicrobiaceae bacterium]|nr:ABC transporter ATP-binding protein [Thermomicrobiaceae bacterium]